MTKHTLTNKILWLFFTVSVIAFFSFLVFHLCNSYKLPLYGSIIIICCALFVLFGISFLLYYYSKPYTKRQLLMNKKIAYFAPEIAFIAVISVRILEFLYSNDILYGRLSYLTDSYVTNDVFVAPDFLTHPFLNILENAMHYTMRLLGNQEAAIVYLFILLQFMTALFLYYAIRNIWGSLSAFLMTLLFFCNPEMIRTIFYISTIQIILPIFILMLFLLSLFIRYKEHSDKSSYMALFVLFSIVIGACIYFEPCFFIILLFQFLYFLFDTDKTTSIMKPFIILIGLISTVAGFFFFLIVPMSVTGVEYLSVLDEYSKQFVIFKALNPNQLLLEPFDKLLIIPSVLLLFYCYFALNKKEQQKSKNIYPIFLTTIISFLYFLFMSESNILSTILYLLISMTAVLSIQGFRYQLKTDVDVDATADTENIEINDEIIKEPVTERMIEPQRVILPGQPLDNPLPGPKKHIKKEFDYAINVSEEKMHYDRNTDEDDDYDLK